MRRALILLAALLILAGGAWWWLAPPGEAQQARAGRGARGGDPIPVLVATAETHDVPIFLDGLGTAQASATVTVRPQVDGKLVEVLFREGQDVKTGDVLARIDPRTYQAALDQAVAKKAQDQASLANARLDYARYSKLAANAYTSAQQADTAKAQVAQLEAQVAQDQAQIDTARAQLSYCTITAPIDGRTGIRQVDQGNLVHATDTTGIVVITTLRPISVVFTLPQQALPRVTAAMARGTPEVLALPQGDAISPSAAGREPLDVGTLAVVDNQVDATTGTIRLKATFPNAKLQLWPGAFLNVRLKLETRTGVIGIPTSAVQRGPQGAFAYVVGDDLTAQRRAVRVSHEEAGLSVVDTGIARGERVVTDGGARLSDKSKVTVTTEPGAPKRPSLGT